MDTLLWCSIPCTGGCPWQNINKHFPGGAARLRMHHALFRKLWSAVETVAARVIKSGGHVAIEWPKSSAYWNWECVVDFIGKYHLEGIRFDGCTLGVVSHDGTPILKPWRVVASTPTLVIGFGGLRCDNSHRHVACRSRDAKTSGVLC